ncbi:glutamine synthetase family protein [Colwelliaceae bacterium BS250]
MDNIENWLLENNIEEVQCVTADHTGIPRGKTLPAQSFLADELRIPEGVALSTASGDLINDDIMFSLIDPRDLDMFMKPDLNTRYVLPWTKKPTAMIIHDCWLRNGEENDLCPRTILKNVLALYKSKGWQPVVAPEMELHVLKTNADPSQELEPPMGRSGRTEAGRQSFGIDALAEYSDFIDLVYDWAKQLNLDLDSVVHEEGAGQLEFNFKHGDALKLADQVFVFKRLVKEAAIQCGITATFMAKPISDEPGNAMHIHQSIISTETGKNIFADDSGDTELFKHYIGGLQKYTGDLMPIFAPNANSYRRFVAGVAAPVNVFWGTENRSVGLRVPEAPQQARRVENRLPGADSNPYLAIAATLLCGYLGMVEEIERSEESVDRVNAHISDDIPTNFDSAIKAMADSKTMQQYLGERFITGFTETRLVDFNHFKSVITSWERRFLISAV